jgi:hypothetical protein
MIAAVGFGLRAMSCALKARARSITRRDVKDLDELRLAVFPDREDIAGMVGRFRELVEAGNLQNAADALLEDLQVIAEAAQEDAAHHAARTQAALAAAGSADWQQRSDCK